MKLPVLAGTFKRRLLLNYRADPQVVAALLPEGLRPKLYADHAWCGICLIRLESLRPAGLPGGLGMSSENAAHRFAVEWTNPDGTTAEGVFVPRRDTDSRLAALAGGRLFPGEQHAACFEVRDEEDRIDFRMSSQDGEVRIAVRAAVADHWPEGSLFPSHAEASEFCHRGETGYSSVHGSEDLQGMRLATNEWRTVPLAVESLYSSYFEEGGRFPEGSIAFDHALLMRDVRHEWRSEPDFHPTHD